MVLTRRAQKFLEAPRLPVELLTEIAKQAPKSSLWALCCTSRVFHELTVRDLYQDAVISCTASYAADTRALIRRVQRWCHTVMEKPEKAALVKSVTVKKLPQWVFCFLAFFNSGEMRRIWRTDLIDLFLCL